MQSFYLTTAIDYANGSPHLGHAYEKILADVIARHRRLTGRHVHFLTGIDEHGQKIVQTAEREKISPQELTARTAPLFLELCHKLEITNDDFIRTSEERHKEVVSSVLTKLHEQGDIYKDTYHGFYSVRQEQFVLEKEKVDGIWPEIYGEVIQIEEENYFFRLSKYQAWLTQYLRENTFVYPAYRQKQVLEFLREPVNDLCISRPIERLAWGIPLPFDPSFVTYVWFDALINYISAVGYGTPAFNEKWPASYHIIGKDILVPAHAVYWPIMLKALDLPLPEHLLVHGWWHLAGQKMSKSTGLTVDPIQLAETFGADALRYFFIREMNVGQDSDFTEQLFLSRYNSDLVNDLGNLLSRLLNMGHRYCSGIVPKPEVQEEPEQSLSAVARETIAATREQFEGFLFHSGLEAIFNLIRATNRYAEIRAPWQLAKSDLPADQAALRSTLAHLTEGLRIAAILLAPVTPQASAEVLARIGLPPVRSWEDQRLDLTFEATGASFGEKTILFPRHSLEPSSK
ncbi:MAG: methionine--tRNA ligase [Puniceicoccaceae bacterium]